VVGDVAADPAVPEGHLRRPLSRSARNLRRRCSDCAGTIST
jgi:hypothetical protein